MSGALERHAAASEFVVGEARSWSRLQWCWLASALALGTIPLAILLGRSAGVWPVVGWSLFLPLAFLFFAFVARRRLEIASLMIAVPLTVIGAMMAFESDPAPERDRTFAAIAMGSAALMLIGLVWTRAPKTRMAIVLAGGAVVVVGRCVLLLVLGPR
ncbi:MAG: hypothetical protein NXI31_12800 [bacterium]|nr:hypothetical protein [bacterium]